MSREDAILDQWFCRAVESYPGETVRFLSTETDRFRNPVGRILRENLAILLRELLGGMNPAATKPALEAVIRLRAVQDVTAAQAVGFIFSVRPFVRQVIPEHDRESLDGKVDQLALLAFEEYVRCRELLSEIRLNEGRRAMAVPAALARARS